MDMAQFIAPKSSQLNADDLVGGPRTITVTKVSGTGNAEQPVAISFEGDEGRPFLPCKSMRRILVAVWGKDASQYVGRSMRIYRDPKVTWGGMEVGGIRISHASDIERDTVIALTETKKSRKPFTVRPLTVAKPEPEKPAEPPTMDNAQTQTGFNDAFEAALKAADGTAAVEAVLAHPKVQKAQAAFKGAQAERLAALIQSALARTAPPAEEPPADAGDGWPGPVTGEAA